MHEEDGDDIIAMMSVVRACESYNSSLYIKSPRPRPISSIIIKDRVVHDPRNSAIEVQHSTSISKRHT